MSFDYDIVCPKCGKTYASSGGACPSCNSTLKDAVQQGAKEDAVDTQGSRAPFILLIGTIIIGGVLYGIFGGGMGVGGNEKKSELDQLQKKPKAEAKASSTPAVPSTKKVQTKIEPKAESKKPGTVLWEFETGGVMHSSPAIGADGTVYIGSMDSKIYALEGKTGAKKWEFITGEWEDIRGTTHRGVQSSPAVGTDGTVYVGARDLKVYALNGQTGAKKWEFETGGDVQSGPAIGADGTVYLGSSDYKVYALDGRTGAKKWEFKTGHWVLGSPAIGFDGTVYVGSADNKVYALEGETGFKLWEFETGGAVTSSPAIGIDGTVYIFSGDDEIYALEALNGSPKWGRKLIDATSSPAIGLDGSVYIGSADKKIYALDGGKGTDFWEFITGDWVPSIPAVGADGTVYVGSLDKKVYALDGQSGAKKWEFVTGDKVTSSPSIGADGTLYIGSQDKKVYALNTDSKGPAKSPWPMRGQNAQHTGRVMKK